MLHCFKVVIVLSRSVATFWKTPFYKGKFYKVEFFRTKWTGLLKYMEQNITLNSSLVLHFKRVDRICILIFFINAFPSNSALLNFSMFTPYFIILGFAHNWGMSKFGQMNVLFRPFIQSGYRLKFHRKYVAKCKKKQVFEISRGFGKLYTLIWMNIFKWN